MRKASAVREQSSVRLLLLLGLIFAWLPCETRVFAQESNTVNSEVTSTHGQADFTPSDFVTLPVTSGGLPKSADAKLATVMILRPASGDVWELRAESPEPGRVTGFIVPQLPQGDYVARYEDGTNRVRDFSFSITPRLRLVPGKIRAKAGENLTVTIRVAGPADSPLSSGTKGADLRVRPSVELSSNNPSLADISAQGGRQVVTGNDGTASFSIAIKSCGPAFFTAHSAGFEPAKFKVDCPPSKPIPVVFVPGTAGSSLSLPDKNVYWLGDNTLYPKTLCKGLIKENLPDEKRPTLGISAEIEEICKNNPALDLSLVDVLKTVTLNFRIAPLEPIYKLFRIKTNKNCWVSTTGQVFCPRLVDVYDNFSLWADKSFKALPAPYDWRKGVDPANAKNIDQVVNRALESSPEHQQVIIIAHSQGGLVSRDYLARTGNGKVTALITAGTPWLGLPKTARALLTGYNFDVGLPVFYSGKVKVTDPLTKKKRTLKFPLRISLINLDTTKLVGRTWPGLFLQLPTPDFMRLYAQAHKSGESSRSIIFGKSPEETISFFKESNERVFNTVADWRARYLGGRNNYGATHYLIGGYNDPKSKVEDQMDMQIADAEEKNLVKKSFFTNLFLKWGSKITKYVCELRRIDERFCLYLDKRYLAVDSDTSWGDGTSPLLSATAGAVLKGEAKTIIDPERLKVATHFLGDDTRVDAVKLDLGLNHGSMLDDPQVRWKIWSFIRLQNSYFGIDLNELIEVYDLRIEITGKKSKRSDLDSVSFLNCNNGPARKLDEDKQPPVERKTTIWKVELPCGKEAAISKLLIKDFSGQAIRLTKEVKGNWKGVDEIRILINGMAVSQQILNDSTGKTNDLTIKLFP